MEYWCLMDNPSGSVYKQMVEVLCANSDMFYFITLSGMDYDLGALEQFKPYLIKKFRTNRWGVTRGPNATLHLVEANQYAGCLLKQTAKSLYDWTLPLPEDLTFVKNGLTWFTCTAHEKFGGFYIRSDVQKKLMNGIRGLKVEAHPFQVSEPFDISAGTRDL